MSIQRSLKYSFGTTIGLFSGGPKHDKLAGQIIRQLQKVSNNSVSFVGVIGNQDKSSFDHVYASSDVLDHNQFEVNRHYVEVVQQSPILPYRAVTHYKNYQLLRTLREHKIYDDISSRRVDALIAVGNYSLMKRLFTGLNQFYKRGKRLKPVTFAFDTLNTFRRVENEEFLDFLFYNLPKQPDNLQKYVFPSMCIGYEGVYEAFRHLKQYNDAGNFNSKTFSYDVGQMIKASRDAFRSSKGINEDNYLIFFAPGNTAQQVKFSFKVFGQSLKKFQQDSKIKGVDKEFFEILVPIPSNNQTIAADIRSRASSLSSKYKVTIIESSDKYAAMCASDFAVLHNGQITVEAAVCQLPATVISNMPNYKAYLTYLFNGHDSPLNIATNMEGYQDLLGSLTAIPEKIKDIMVDHFGRPKLRFYYAKLYRDTLQQMLLRSGQNPSMSVEETGLEVACKQIYKSAKVYRNTDVNVRISNDKRRILLNV